jgi:hypothetical protein
MRYIGFLTVLLLTGCAVSAPPIPEEIASAIPEGANTVELRSSTDVDAYFNEVRDALVRRGFQIRNEDDRAWRIDTEPQEVGNRTAMRITLRASPLGNGSRLEAIGHWSTDTGDSGFDGAGSGVSGAIENWYQAEWGSDQRSTYAFGQLAVIMNEIPHVEAVYATR